MGNRMKAKQEARKDRGKKDKKGGGTKGNEEAMKEGRKTERKWGRMEGRKTRKIGRDTKEKNKNGR